MAIITRQELEDAAADAQTLEDFINGAADLNGNGQLTTRLGRTLQTLAKLVEVTQSTLDPNAVNAQLALKATITYVDDQIATRAASSHTHTLASLTGGGDMARLAASAKVITDWDAVSENGWYYSVASSSSNAPNTSGFFVGMVVKRSDDWLVQYVADYSNEETGYWLRHKRGGTFGTWLREYKTADDINELIKASDTSKVYALPTVRQTSQSYRSGCVIMQDRTIRMWGDGASDQLGQGDTPHTDRLFPQPPAFPPHYAGNIVKLVRSGRDSWAIMDNGDVWSWGQNTYGCLGHGTTAGIGMPTKIAALDGIDIVDVFSGRHSSYLSGYAIYLASDGRAYACGYNGQGQLGLGDTTQRTTPVLMAKTDWVSFSATCVYGHTAGIDTSGRLWTWGHNDAGQLGNGTTTRQTTPQHINSFGALTLTKVFCASNSQGTNANSSGQGATVAIASDGTAWAWGQNDGGNLGIGTNTDQTIPQQIGSVSGVVDIMAEAYNHDGGSGNTLLVTNDRVYMSGDNTNKQLGDNTTTDNNTMTEVPNSYRVGRLIVKAVIAGTRKDISLFILYDDGEIHVAGQNNNGQLGVGTNVDVGVLTPMLLPLDKANDKAVDICPVGYLSEIGLGILTENGDYWQTGYGGSQQLGIGSSTCAVPVQVKF